MAPTAHFSVIDLYRVMRTKGSAEGLTRGLFDRSCVHGACGSIPTRPAVVSSTHCSSGCGRSMQRSVPAKVRRECAVVREILVRVAVPPELKVLTKPALVTRIWRVEHDFMSEMFTSCVYMT
jgi:hypothetical protein